MPLNFIDCFCGAGGFTQGLKAAGMHHIVGIEIDPTFAAIYAANHHDVIVGDINNVTKSDIESYLKGGSLNVIAGSPPCQSVSRLGLRTIDDPRDILYKQMVRLTKLFQPQVVLLENVAGLLTPKNGITIADLVIRDFHRIGYELRYKVLNAADFNTPQNRRRVFFIGVRGGQVHPGFPEPVSTVEPTIRKYLLAEKDVAEKYYHSMHRVENFKERTARAQRNGLGFQMQILDRDKPSYTITSSCFGNQFYYALLPVKSHAGFRMLTCREVASIMGFPKSYRLIARNEATIYRALGNAVCPPVAKILGIWIRLYLKK